MTAPYIPESGDLVWVDFNPTLGREQAGRRPALILSPRDLSENAGFVIVAPITSRVRPFPTSVVLPMDVASEASVDRAFDELRHHTTTLDAVVNDAGGANMVCFTTGRGSVFGCKPAPSIKLATNTPMYKRMEDDMDVNCGTILDGEESVQECGQRIFELMLKTASGQPTKSESFDFGGAEFAPWVLGATM